MVVSQVRAENEAQDGLNPDRATKRFGTAEISEIHANAGEKFLDSFSGGILRSGLQNDAAASPERLKAQGQHTRGIHV
jgi:hypothetical protein